MHKHKEPQHGAHERPLRGMRARRRILFIMLATGALIPACSAGMAPMAPADMAAGPMATAGPMGDAPAPMEGREGAHRPRREAAPPPPPAPMAAADKPAAEEMEMANRDGIADQKPRQMGPVWAPVRQFPVPNYEAQYDGPRDDFRETVFWAPRVQTDQSGRAQVSFYLSDAVTTFRATAEGMSNNGVAGRGEVVIASKLPVSLAAKLPLEVSSGDEIELPVTVANTTWRPYGATLSTRFGAAFDVSDKEAQKAIKLAARETKTFYYKLKVVGKGKVKEEGLTQLSVESARLSDAMNRTVRVVPAGFPREQSIAGKIAGRIRHEIDLPEPIDGTLDAKVAFYPTPKATLVAGTESMLREPTGCFEQASSANYPNVMVMSYLKVAGGSDPGATANALGMLDRGYKKITGYESPGHGFEWFGGAPAHEALTAYGVLEFTDMAAVYKDLDRTMVKRTISWLKSRRDGKGGYQRDAKALDSFGAAGEEVTNAYITYALTEAGERDIAGEIAYLKKLAASSKDAYVMALAVNALANVEPSSAETGAAVRRLVGMQAKDGRYPGADHSITRSGGIALEIEATALATLALMKAGGQGEAVNRGIGWIEKQRSGWGGFGSTQSTVLALKVLARAASQASPTEPGTIFVSVNGGPANALAVSAGSSDALELVGLDRALKKGKNTIDIYADNPAIKLPYSLAVGYRTLKPNTSPKSPIVIKTTAPDKAKVGDAVKVAVVVENKLPKGIPMTIARIGIPGGLSYQTWQLDELKAKGLVDFYETREREVIVYLRAMGPKEKKSFDIDLLASVPGSYAGPASQGYLYYTDEHRTYVDPLRITVSR